MTAKDLREDEQRSLARNRRARHDYRILETYEAGIVLLGTEVKAVRAGKIQLRESFVEVADGEAWLVGAHISPYDHAGRDNHDPERRRKLLLGRRELDKLWAKVQLRGLTVVPLEVYLRGNWIKVRIGVAEGKKLYDKRQAEKRRTLDREAEAELARRR